MFQEELTCARWPRQLHLNRAWVQNSPTPFDRAAGHKGSDYDGHGIGDDVRFGGGA